MTAVAPTQTLSPPPSSGGAASSERELLLSVFKTYLDDLGRLGGRHETARQFYLSLISALFVFLSLTGATGPLVSLRGAAPILIGIVGVILSLLWARHMRSFGILFEAKLQQLRGLEKSIALAAQPFTNDEEYLKTHKYIHVTSLDTFVAYTFAALFVALIIFKGAGL